MNDFKEMTMEEWTATYKPITNHIDKNASFQDESGTGLMFETYGDEIEYIRQTNPACVWTYGDGDDGGTYIWNDFHFINRLGYFVTEVPCPPDTIIQIKVSSYWYYCEGCGADIEDDGQLINDRYYEYERCPICITEEEMLKLEQEEMTLAGLEN
jgi:hypothetical protein